MIVNTNQEIVLEVAKENGADIGTWDKSGNGKHLVSFTEQQLLAFVNAYNARMSEPFGYFKAEPFCWVDCASTDEGAIALFETPQPPNTVPLEEIVTAIEKAVMHGWLNRLELRENIRKAMLSASPTPPNAVPLEKYNKLLEALKELVDENKRNRISAPNKTLFEITANMKAEKIIAEAEGNV